MPLLTQLWPKNRAPQGKLKKPHPLGLRLVVFVERLGLVAV